MADEVAFMAQLPEPDRIHFRNLALIRPQVPTEAPAAAGRGPGPDSGLAPAADPHRPDAPLAGARPGAPGPGRERGHPGTAAPGPGAGGVAVRPGAGSGPGPGGREGGAGRSRQAPSTSSCPWSCRPSSSSRPSSWPGRCTPPGRPWNCRPLPTGRPGLGGPHHAAPQPRARSAPAFRLSKQDLLARAESHPDRWRTCRGSCWIRIRRSGPPRCATRPCRRRSWCRPSRSARCRSCSRRPTPRPGGISGTRCGTPSTIRPAAPKASPGRWPIPGSWWTCWSWGPRAGAALHRTVCLFTQLDESEYQVPDPLGQAQGAQHAAGDQDLLRPAAAPARRTRPAALPRSRARAAGSR